MKILFIEWPSFGRKDLKEAFTAEGHDLIIFPFAIDLSKLHNDPTLEDSLSKTSALRREARCILFSP